MYYSFIKDMKCLNVYKKVVHQSSAPSSRLQSRGSPLETGTPNFIASPITSIRMLLTVVH